MGYCIGCYRSLSPKNVDSISALVFNSRMRFIATMFVILGGVLLAPAQTPTSKPQTGFVLDRQKPFAYIEFVKTAPRKPFPGEPETGLWLRFVNNCNLPTGITTFGSGDELRVEHQVVYEDEVGLIPYRDGKRMSPEKRPRSEMPKGYGFDVGSWQVIQPGEHFRFSIPINHVSEDWHILVRFEFMLDGSPNYVRQPTMEVSFSTYDIPNNELPKFEKRSH